MRVALFSPFSPDIGGGSVQLRSHLEHMPELNVQWYYLADAPVERKNCHWLGKPLTVPQLGFDLSARTGFLPGSTKMVRSIVERLDADLYWIVGFYEGVSVADELISSGKPVHMTVHDDPMAMLIRGRRLRPLWPLMRPVFSRVIRSAKSVDVTSTRMRDYFNEKYKVHSFALYKYLESLPEAKPKIPNEILTVGHIGSLYHPGPFRRFVLACCEYAAAQKRSLKIVRIGTSPQIDQIASENLVSIENHGELPERDSLPILADCDFVYAMYPNGIRFEDFRRTSLPIKLSTYIQAQRPIFAHTPPDSGLAALVAKYGVGVVCTSNQNADIQRSIQALFRMRPGRANFEAIRESLMGREQLEQLRNALRG